MEATLRVEALAVQTSFRLNVLLHHTPNAWCVQSSSDSKGGFQTQPRLRVLGITSVLRDRAARA